MCLRVGLRLLRMGLRLGLALRLPLRFALRLNLRLNLRVYLCVDLRGDRWWCVPPCGLGASCDLRG